MLSVGLSVIGQGGRIYAHNVHFLAQDTSKKLGMCAVMLYTQVLGMPGDHPF